MTYGDDAVANAHDLMLHDDRHDNDQGHPHHSQSSFLWLCLFRPPQKGGSFHPCTPVEGQYRHHRHCTIVRLPQDVSNFQTYSCVAACCE